ncbi:hypothetical protein LTR62_003067 [Meristemomyces frigidus]|uniref:Uncharacterized protein n=1 Tax=Meristemomyces frigidus TaxID=1508187 RepID=A0AAN7TLB3_9PEZI|nr:hypothetical protein LTR62_003067 [Meristemomyces frigidus]
MSTTESSQGTHATREATPQEQQFITDILKLYQCEPNEQSYSHYAETATFHDPVSIAKGKESIMSQFNGMPKIFARSETKEIAVLASSTPSELMLNLTQHYVFKSPIPLKKEGSEKTVNSKLTFKLNQQGLIEEHVEEWDHEGNKTGEDGFMGKLQEGRKKVDAKLVESTVSSDPAKA